MRFEREQVTFDIAGVRVGGQPGEWPTVLIGTIFYEGHRVVRDPARGAFDREGAEALIRGQEEMSRLTGNPHMVDVFASTSEALCRYIDFVADVTGAPFLVDSAAPAVRLSGMRHAVEAGLGERAVYNSIDYRVEDGEVEALREMGTRSAVLLAYNPRNAWPEGRVEILEDREGRRGLLRAAEEAGIRNVLVDTSVLDVPSISLASEAIHLVKSRLGLPAGCAPSNAVTTWKRAKEGLGPHALDVCLASSAVLTQARGADFVLYGPIKYADRVFPACALTDALQAYQGRRQGIKPKTGEHPLAKIL